MCEKDYIWNSDICSFENGKYVGSFIDESLITNDEMIDTTKSILTKTVPMKSNLKNFHILLVFLLITIALLIAVIIYCYLRKYQAKENIYWHITLQITV